MTQHRQGHLPGHEVGKFVPPATRRGPWSRPLGQARVILFVAVLTGPLLQAQVPNQDGARNFDARIGRDAPTADAQSRGTNTALASFAAGRPNLAVTVDDTFGTTSKLYDRLDYLTPPDARDATTIALDFIQNSLPVLGLTQTDLAEYEVRDLVVNQATGSTHLYLRQQFQGIPLYNGLLHVNINRDGRILSVNNAWVPDLAAQANQATPGLSAGDAVANAAKALALPQTAPPASLAAPTGSTQRTRLDPSGISAEPLEAELVWLPITRGTVRLAWNFQVHTSDQQHAYDYTIDAETGAAWTRFDWVTGANYRVYEAPAESPNHTSPTPPSDGRTLVTDPANATASPYGWHDTDGVAGAEYTIMRGNNVHAYIDSAANNSPPGSEPDCGASLNCDFAVDLTAAPSDSEAAAVANLFYWSNYIHDSQYHYGFTESAGNFQVNNYGRGGQGNDDVRAEAQDGGGTNNANMMTPADGSRPRMQMYLWTTATPDIDGDFENGIIAHEYGHGISIRLVGGPSNVSCLNNTQQPGEGLSDWWSLVYTAKSGDVGATGRGIGTYALNQATTGLGIRAQRYSTDSSQNTWTYASINGMSVPHGVGSVFGQAAWQMYWTLVNAHGFDADLMNGSGTAGNQRALLYMNEGLMNTSCSPSFLDVRDGIIQAATDNHGGADTCRIWEEFAEMGMGTNAVGNASTTAPTNGFGVPLSCLSDYPTISIADGSVTEGDSSQTVGGLTVSLSAASDRTVAVDYTSADNTATTATTTTNVSNTTSLSIPGTGTVGSADVYPSAITVTRAATTLSSLTVTLTGFSHTYPSDVDVLLVGPTGASVILMSDIGGSTDASNVTLTFSDTGASLTPSVSGTYAPNNSGGGDSFPSPAPNDTPGTTLSTFAGTDPNGTWSLYIVDDFSGDSGSLSGGWSLGLETSDSNSDYNAATGTVTFSPGETSKTASVTVVGDLASETNETFLLNLANAVNAAIGDSQGVVTIVNDDGAPWTDDPLTAETTMLKAVHITELRSRINALRTANGLSVATWTNSITAGATVAAGQDLTELRTALDAVYTRLSQTPPSYTDPTITTRTTVIKAVHITELRTAINALGG